MTARIPTLGLSIDATRMCAALPDGRTTIVPLAEELRSGDLERLAVAVGVPRARVTVALAPPLIEVRRLTMPRLPDAELRRILTRDAARYFLAGRTPQVVGVRALARSGSPVPILAAAAPAAVIETIEQGCREAGWSLDAIVPAHQAWLAAAGGRPVVAETGDIAVLLVSERGVPVALRRLSRSRPEAIADALREVSGSPLTLGNDEALAVAAVQAPRERGMQLRSDTRRAEERRSDRRLAAALSIAALLCIMLVGVVERWGVRRELREVRARRAEIQQQAAAAMASREAAAESAALLDAVADLEAGSPRWSAFLSDLADHLPRDAHLTSFRAAGDSVVLDGVSRQAATVFQAVQRMPRVGGVRAEAPIRQSIGAGGAVQERFLLGGSVRLP